MTLAALDAGDPSSQQLHPPAPTRLDRAVLDAPVEEVARRLLGTLLVRDDGTGRRIARIVETEAYGGPEDRASHARAGRTPRTGVMFGPPGRAYVYLVYGMHHCLNVVCAPLGQASAVLIRAVEPLAGVERMRERRGPSAGADARVGAGPARACQALDIDRRLDGIDLLADDRLWLAAAPSWDAQLPHPVVAGPRVGVDYAGAEWAGRAWRFGIRRPSLAEPALPRRRLMDARSAELLELPLVRERLAAYAAFAPSRRLALSLEPTSDALVVTRRLDETDEARWLLSVRPDIGIGGARDIGPIVARASRGGRLDPGELWAVAETLVATGRLADALRELEQPLLHGLYRSLDALPGLRSRLEASVDPAGEILDTASPTLGGLRRAVRIAHERLRARLETLIRSEVAAALQEPLVTMRAGRYVVPVRSDAQSRVKGIVHDRSASGQTLFIEPLIAVELSNAWREAQLAAQAEEERVLDELSGHVAIAADALASDLEALARFDLWLCRARLAEEMRAVRAEDARGARVSLRSARHPGLTGDVVPVDVELGGEYTALVITGPNTGGKTVALRTVGLLALMHQSGLHVPAASGSALPIFRDVLADIGDEQSVAQSLSTFSGHLRTITRIVGAAGEGSLVLLDELGAGTDPTEGSALAQALLDHFIRVGSLVVATTHYAELKTYAHNEPRARNASVDFDLATLAPTYHLSIGLPGTSQAFAIAERLGLPSELVDDARSRLSVAQREFESTLASIRESQRSTVASEARAADAEQRVRAALAEAEEERRRARAERRIAAGEARRQAEVALGAIEAEIAEMRGALARETLTEARLDQAQARIGARLGLLPGVEPVADTAADAAASGAWSVGVHAATISGWEGTIAAVDAERGRATLEVGGLRVDVALDELVAATPGASGAPATSRGSEATTVRSRPAAPRSGRRGEFGESGSIPQASQAASRGAAGHSGRKGGTPPRSIASSLDLRGARVEEALELLEAYLDAAAQAEAGRVTVVHGHGSGAMRDAVRRTLGSHPLVREWRPGERGEGGDGATVVSL